MAVSKGILSTILRRIPRLDAFNTWIVAMVILASILPARGVFAQWLDVGTNVGIAMLFFLHGAKLSREDIVGGIGHWRLHIHILVSTFVLFPLVILAFKPLEGLVIPPELMVGLLFLAALPSTVQSSIAFTSIARGNVAAAVAAASLSNVAGVFFTPILVSILINLQGEMNFLQAVLSITLQILLPFVVGHLSRPWIGGWITRRQAFLNNFDRGTIVAIVYAAFSVSVVDGMWKSLSWVKILATGLLCCVILAIILYLVLHSARWLGFNREDQIAIMFCGSKKSLASGLPMAKVLFPGSSALGATVLPLMIFHQIQLMVCAALANRYAAEYRRLHGGDVPAHEAASS